MKTIQKISVHFFVFIGISFLGYNQKFDVSGKNREGKIYYKDGSEETGKLTFDETTLAIKYDDKSKKGIPISTIDRFEIYKKNDTIPYSFILSERNHKKKKQRKYLGYLVYDNDKVGFLMNRPPLPALAEG